eukprot:jgi/Tetstr1/445012/TSEL_032820.t1
MEAAIDDGGHRFRLTYLRKHWDTQMRIFALDVVRERYLRHATQNMGSPKSTKQLLQLIYKDRVSAREALAPRAASAKDTTKDAGKDKAKAEASVADKAE